MKPTPHRSDLVVHFIFYLQILILKSVVMDIFIFIAYNTNGYKYRDEIMSYTHTHTQFD